MGKIFQFHHFQSDRHSLQQETCCQCSNVMENEYLFQREYYLASEVDELKENQPIEMKYEDLKNESITEDKKLEKYIVGNVQKFQCDQCGSKFDKTKLLSMHKLRTHGDPVQCDVCKKVLKSSKGLKDHKRLVHEPPNLGCALCNKLFSRSWTLKNHIQLCGQMTRGQGDIPCDVCGNKFAHKASLKEHIRTFHTTVLTDGSLIVHTKFDSTWKQKEEIVCQICLSSFKKRKYLKKHMITVHEYNPHDDTTNINMVPENVNDLTIMKDKVWKLQCPSQTCEKVFVSKQSLKKHKLNDHFGEKIFVCILCNSGLKSLKNMITHTNKVHTTRDFSCQNCNKTFKLKNTLKTHKQTHVKTNEESHVKTHEETHVKTHEKYHIKAFEKTHEKTNVKTNEKTHSSFEREKQILGVSVMCYSGNT